MAAAWNANAFDKDNLEQLRATNECSRCDLTAIELPGVSLSEATLKWVKLTGANLADVNLSDVDLYGA